MHTLDASSEINAFNASQLLEIAKDSFPIMSSDWFKQLLFNGQKDFKGWDLSDVDFIQIDKDVKKINETMCIFINLDFSNAILPIDLMGLDFSRCNFTYANLKKADLSQCKFYSANLSHANLSEAYLSEAIFTCANLDDAILGNANGYNITFYQTNFKHAKLNFARLTDSDFTEANLAHAELRFINLEGSNLTRTNLIEAQADNAQLRETVLKNANLKNINLMKSYLVAANLEDAFMRGANLKSANLQYAQAMDTDFQDARLDDANLQNADLSRASFVNAYLHQANFMNANLRGTNFDFASLLRTKVDGANFERTQIGQTNFNEWLRGSSFDWVILKQASREKYPDRYPLINSSYKEAAISLVRRCLPTEWLPPKDCLFNWDDIVKLSPNGYKSCDIGKIKLDAQSFLIEFIHRSVAEQKQRLQVAAVTNISGNALAKELIGKLIQYQKLFGLLLDYAKLIAEQSDQLKYPSSMQEIFSDSNATSLLFNRPIPLSIHAQKNNNTSTVSFNTTIFDINAISFSAFNRTDTKQVAYDLGFDFLSYEIRELLEKIQFISMYKNPIAAVTTFILNLKSEVALNSEQISWLNLFLNMTHYPEIVEKYSDIFSRCQLGCFNVSFSDKDLIRTLLVKLINPFNFKKSVINFKQNVTSVLPYQSVLAFSQSELRVDENRNFVAYSVNNQSIADILQNYAKIPHSLCLSYSITQANRLEKIIIDRTNTLTSRNDLTYDSHLIGSESVIISAYETLNITQLPLPSVTLHRWNNNQPNLLDFQILAQQIKKALNTNLHIKPSIKADEVMIEGFIQQPNQKIPVITLYLKNFSRDPWDTKLKIIQNLQPMQIVGRGSKMHLQALPYRVPASKGNIDFFNIENLEDNTRIFVSATVDDVTFFRYKEDLILSDALTSIMKKENPYFLVLQNFYREPEKSVTHTLEFINKKIFLKNEERSILNAPKNWDQALKELKKTLDNELNQPRRGSSKIISKNDCYKANIIYINNDDRYRRDIISQAGQSSKKISHITSIKKVIQQQQGLFSLKPELNKTDLVIYAKKQNNIETTGMIPLPMSALLGGFLSAHFDHIGEMHQEECPSLPAYMTYGFKPFLSALISSGFNYVLFDQDEEIEEKFARFFTYFILNFLGVIFGQPLTQKIAETVHNKLMCFLVQSLTWALLWNPSLFASESLEIIPVVCMQLLQGLFFKGGEETYRLVKKSFNFSTSFWHTPAVNLVEQKQASNNEVIQMRL